MTLEMIHMKMSCPCHSRKGQLSSSIPRGPQLNMQFRRKLPEVNAALTVKVPLDDPALHQGRTRTVPHVEGQFAAYVYLPVSLDDNQALRGVLEDVILYARELEPAVICIWKEGASAARELHISLTRTIYLRSHHRDELRRAVKAAARATEPCVDLTSFKQGYANM